MRELRTVIQISAPRDRVWQVLTDFEKWKDWNPIVNQVRGSASEHSRLKITMRGPDGEDTMQYQATVLEAIPPKSFRWRATMMGGFMFSNDRVFELAEKNGGTELVNAEQFSGLLVPLFWGRMSLFVVPMLKKMNKALKDKLETAN
jgi:hypothetical protein